MLKTKTGADELNHCLDRSWLLQGEQRFDAVIQVNAGEYDKRLEDVESETDEVPFEGLIYAGQRVFFSNEGYAGLTTKLFLGLDEQVAHLAIQSGRLFGHHKTAPISSVSAVTPDGIMLSITHKQFQQLPEYQDDSRIREEVDRALWKDEILRNTDYYQIHVHVRDGIVILNGYLVSISSQWRVENAVENIPGILGIESYLIADDKLLLEVAKGLIEIERVEGSHVFAKVQNGAVVLSGKVISLDVRDRAEQCAANVAWVRGVINNIAVPGFDLKAEDQRFLQPVIGETIFFRDGPSGVVKQVIINRNNRRVVAMVIQGQFPDAYYAFGSSQAGDSLPPVRLAIIPMRVIRYLTSISGFLSIDSTETSRYQDFSPDCLVTPGAGWLPPYPYCADDVRFFAE